MYYIYVITTAILVGYIVVCRLQLSTQKKRIKVLESDNIDQKLKQANNQKKLNDFGNEGNTNNVMAKLVEQSPNAIMIMDTEANILSINKGFEDMYEHNFNSFTSSLGANYRQTSFGSDVEYRLNWVFENKKPYRYEALNITQSGKELWTQTALMPIFNTQGEITHLATIDTDIHQRVVKSDSLIEEMEALYAKIDKTAQTYKVMEQESENLFASISEFYTLIDDTKTILSFIKSISDKTRILGLNASIEAGRAGEFGAGFRVITNEIIDISNNTINSVTEITSIVNSIISKQSNLNKRKDESAEQIKEHEKRIVILKDLVATIQQSITEFKSLA